LFVQIVGFVAGSLSLGIRDQCAHARQEVSTSSAGSDSLHHHIDTWNLCGAGGQVKWVGIAVIIGHHDCRSMA